MNTAELIAEKAKALPAGLHQEALRYLDYLSARQTTEFNDRDWARFSAEQLAGQYAPADSVYDHD